MGCGCGGLKFDTFDKVLMVKWGMRIAKKIGKGSG